MDYSKFINKKTLRAAGLILILLIILGVLYDNFIFRVKSTDPAMNNVPTSIAYIKVSFSQPIDSIEGVSINNNVVPKTNLSLDGKSIKININDGLLDDGVNYSLKLSGIHSKWFNNSISNISYTFTPHFVEYDSLSSDQRKALVDQSNSGQIDDPFLDNNFPIITDEFKIDATNGGDGKTVLVNITFLDEIPNYDEGGAVTPLPDQKAEDLRTKALQSIKDHKGNPDKYVITYSNNYLNGKYGKDLD